jgi:hypothetical protein
LNKPSFSNHATLSGMLETQNGIHSQHAHWGSLIRVIGSYFQKER